MSTRTLIEISHNHLSMLIGNPEILQPLMTQLKGCMPDSTVYDANDAGRALDYGHGIHIVMRRHHRTDVTVSTRQPEIRP